MNKFKSVKVEHLGKEYFFVSKKSAFTADEIQYYFEAQQYKDAEHFAGKMPESAPASKWIVSQSLEKIFLDDARVMGAKFCASKYGVSVEDIKREANRLNPGAKVKE
jgi:YHS domain-containing protein